MEIRTLPQLTPYTSSSANPPSPNPPSQPQALPPKTKRERKKKERTSINILPRNLRIPTHKDIATHPGTAPQRHGPPFPFPRDLDFHPPTYGLPDAEIAPQGRHFGFVLGGLPGREAGFERVGGDWCVCETGGRGEVGAEGVVDTGGGWGAFG